jgi:hypothetical protein
MWRRLVVKQSCRPHSYPYRRARSLVTTFSSGILCGGAWSSIWKCSTSVGHGAWSSTSGAVHLSRNRTSGILDQYQQAGAYSELLIHVAEAGRHILNRNPCSGGWAPTGGHGAWSSLSHAVHLSDKHARTAIGHGGWSHTSHAVIHVAEAGHQQS